MVRILTCCYWSSPLVEEIKKGIEESKRTKDNA